MDYETGAREIQADLGRVTREFSKAIVGNERVLSFILKALFAGGHILLEGLPGLGKTLMIKTVSEILDLEFRRIQFTPDLMPADITGTNLIVEDESGHRRFRFERGPIFGNILLADEINRASPKTQSALLQAMEERECTVFGESHPLDKIFLALATQNPIEMAGTYPLPEAQLDRFMFKLDIRFPPLDQLREIGRLNVSGKPRDQETEAILGRDRILAIQQFMEAIPLTDRIYDFASELVFHTHPGNAGSPDISRDYVKYGASPRGLKAILAAARATAVMAGRFNISIDDIQTNYLQCLRHRIILNLDAQVEEVKADDILSGVFSSLARKYGAK